MNLFDKWMEAKERERIAVEERRAIEDQLVKEWNIPECFEGTLNRAEGEYRIKVQGRQTRKVDAQMIIDISAEYGLDADLGRLVRWTPEINMAAWRQANDEVVRLFSQAVTTKPGRPSFQIYKEEK